METSLFGGRDENRPADSKKNVGVPSPGMQKLNESVNETGSRLAVLEERMANLRKKSQLIEHSLLSYEKETRTDLKALTETMLDLARKVEEVKEKIDAMNGSFLQS
jgi:predicted  nucleic acid-binding Zn-ribbon protein